MIVVGYVTLVAPYMVIVSMELEIQQHLQQIDRNTFITLQRTAYELKFRGCTIFSLSMASENPASAEAIHVGVDKFHGTCKWHAK